MIRLGLIGYPLGHSLSPRIHEAALQSCGLQGSYSLFSVDSNDQQGLSELVSNIRSGEMTGFNVTIPHKQSVITYLDELTPVAQSIGAVNTIYLRGDKLIGDNTDAPGFLSDLRKFLTTGTQRRGELNALVLGAGGSARAVVYALLSAGWSVTVAARRPDRAKQLADSFTKYQLHITDFTLSHIDLPTFTLVVNTTPLGMTPSMDRSPWPENLPFPPRAAIYDLVYNPGETKLVRDACLQGLSATTGLGMLIEQAALAFERWTGLEPSREDMLHAIDETNY